MCWCIERAASDLGHQRVHHDPHLAHECLTGILVAGHTGESFLFPLSRELRRREQRSVEGADQRQALWGRDECLLVASHVPRPVSNVSIMAARVAGVPRPASFIASRSSSSSIVFPAVSMAPSRVASVKRGGAFVCLVRVSA